MLDTPPPTGPICERIIFRGRVQGVGFRQHTRGLAQGFPLIGYVRNLGDGSVEVVAKIQSDFRDNVTGVEREIGELLEEFTTFDIRF
jgi:hydrogenase maturation factor HypF (carbamoyltransferase family)